MTVNGFCLPLLAESLKLQHATELAETQTLYSLNEYLLKNNIEQFVIKDRIDRVRVTLMQKLGIESITNTQDIYHVQLCSTFSSQSFNAFNHIDIQLAQIPQVLKKTTYRSSPLPLKSKVSVKEIKDVITVLRGLEAYSLL